MTDRKSTLKTFPPDWLDGRYKPWQYAVFGLAIPPFLFALPLLLFDNGRLFNVPGLGIAPNFLLMGLNIVSGLGLWRSVSGKYEPGLKRKVAQTAAVLATVFLGFLLPAFVGLLVVAMLVAISNG